MGRKNNLENAYQELNGKNEEEIKSNLEKLSQDILNATKAFENMPDSYTDKDGNEKENSSKKQVEKNLQKMKNQKRVLEGYSKNKNSINKIRNMQTILLKKKEKFSADIELYISDKKAIEKQLEDAKKEKTSLEARADGSVTDNEYNEAFNKVERLSQESERLEKRIKETKKAIESLSISTSKCDLAWKYLIQGKDWDDIKAKEANFNNHTYKADKQNKEKIDKLALAEKTKQITQSVDNEINNENANRENINLPAIEKKGIAKFFQNLSNKIKRLFGRNKENFSIELNEENKNESNEVKTSNETKNQNKKTFIEELRYYAEGKENEKYDQSKELHQKQEKSKEIDEQEK